MDGTDIVSKHNRSAGMMEDNTAGFSLVLRRRLMTVDRISGFLQGASMPLRLHVSPIMTVRAALRYEALAHDETVLARRARLAWLAYRMAVADGLFRNVTDPAVMDGLRWMLSTGITDGELFDAGLSSGIVLAAATCDDAVWVRSRRRFRGRRGASIRCGRRGPHALVGLAFLVLSFRCRWVVDGFVSGKGWLFIPPGWAGKPGSRCAWGRQSPTQVSYDVRP